MDHMHVKGRMTARTIFTVLTTLTITLQAGAVSSYRQYYIVPVDSSILCQHYLSGTCFTLDQLPSQISDTGDIAISFLPGEHFLTKKITFPRRTNITLSSEQPDNHSYNTPKISCVPNTRIEAIETDTFILQGLMIYGCEKQYGSDFDGGSAIHLTKTTAVIRNSVFHNNSCWNKFCRGGAIFSKDSTVMIDSCVFENNTSHFGGGAVYASGGTVSIKHTRFANNTAYGDHGGGAVYMDKGTVDIINSTLYRNTASTSNGGAVNTADGGILNIAKSMFGNNKAANKGGAVKTEKGGIVIITNSDFVNNSADTGGAVLLINGTIDNTIFKHNTATGSSGGALSTALSTLQNGIVKITNSKFEHNTANAGDGGAVHTEYGVQLYITDSMLSNNEALKGGSIGSFKNSIITLSNTKMMDNKAGYGGAVYLEQSTLNGKENVIITKNTATQAGGGIFAFYSTIQFGTPKISIKERLDLKLISNNTSQQDGGGVHLTTSRIAISYRTVQIEGNCAHQYGGGIYFQDKSQLVVTGSNLLILKNNSAVKGGAMYVLDSTSGKELCNGLEPSSTSINILQECFLQLRNTHFIFEKNTAEEVSGGDDIYGGLLDRCISNYHIHPRHQLIAKLNPEIDSTARSISSDPVRVCICENDTVLNCNYTHPTVFKKKGETFTLNVVAVDQVGNPINATLISSLPKSKNGRLKEGQQFRSIGHQCTELEYNVYSSESSAVLELYADGPCSNLGISKQKINIIFMPCTCPVGLESQSDKIQDLLDCSCSCADDLKLFISNCSPKNETVQINENIWIQYINHTNSSFVIHHCPFDYCVQKPVNINLVRPDQQCAFNRTGRLCGQCAQGLSLVFASSRCEQCSNYYLFLLLPFALAGIALVAFILVLNMTVATGTIHGLIFYANIIAANHSIFMTFDTENFLTVFISWLNLDLGIETCFYNGMDSYGKFLLQLVFPVYVSLLIAIIIMLCNWSQRIASLFGKKDPEATLYTLMLLSYSKLVRNIIAALQFALIDYPDGQKAFWLYNANVPYFTPSHIPRFLAVFFITFFGVVYMTLLLFGELFNRCSEYRLMKWTTHRYYIHFLKAHHAPLTDKNRYWVGLLLLARLFQYLLSALTADDSVIILSVGTIAGALLLLKQNKQVYNKWLVDLLETVFMANLSIFSLSTYYVREVKGNQQALAIVSMSISFIAFLGIVLHHILDTCGVKPGELLDKVLTKHRERQHYQPVAINEDQLESDDELLIQLDDVNSYADNGTDNSMSNDNDPARYLTPPIIRSAIPADQLREPALDVLTPVRPEDYNILRTPTIQLRGRKPTSTEINIKGECID